MMNTYDNSEYLAKAKLAMADSWYREGGAHGFAQAEAEYKDFILFYPTMEEAAEAQEKICKMQYQADGQVRPRHRARAARRGRVPAAYSCSSPTASSRRRRSRCCATRRKCWPTRNSGWGMFYHQRAACRRAANRLPGAGRSIPALQPGRRGACGIWRIPTAAWATGSKTSRPLHMPSIVRDYPLSVHADAAKEAEGDEAAGAGSRPGGRSADEIRTRKIAASAACWRKAWGPFGSRPDTAGRPNRGARR